MNRLDKLESRSIHIFREAYSEFQQLCMLWSIGKDSTVLLWLARKAFFGHVPFPLVHIDTRYKIDQMTDFRDRVALEWNLDMIYGVNQDAIDRKETFPDGNATRLACCRSLKTLALERTLSGEGDRFRMNHKTGSYEVDANREPYTGVIVGVRADEEGSRSKERYFSPRDTYNNWDVGDQPPELWNQFKTDFAPGTHIRVHPLLDWTELDIWDAGPARVRWNQLPGPWTRLSRNSRRGNLPISRSGPAGSRIKKMVADSRNCAKMDTCSLGVAETVTGDS